jgi:hypothetical protein
MSLAYEGASPGQQLSHQSWLPSNSLATLDGPKAGEVSLKLSQAIFGRLGRSATHDQSSHVCAVLHQAPFSLGEPPVWGESRLVVNERHGFNVRRNA